MSDILEIVPIGRVLRLSLNRPEKRNALNAELCRLVVHAVEDAAQHAGVGAILLTGNGLAFCAGMDLSEIGSVSAERLDAAHTELFSLGARIGKPIIAAVQGAAFGGGTGLAANCHIVIASENATFGLTEIRLGLWPFLVFQPVSAAIGERRTLELALTGRTFGAAEAKEIGLAHEVVPDAVERALAVAQAIAMSSPTSIRRGMAFAQQIRESEWSEAAELGREVRQEVFESDDFREGVQAFREKRRPKWPSLEGAGDNI